MDPEREREGIVHRWFYWPRERIVHRQRGPGSQWFYRPKERIVPSQRGQVNRRSKERFAYISDGGGRFAYISDEERFVYTLTRRVKFLTFVYTLTRKSSPTSLTGEGGSSTSLMRRSLSIP